MGWGVGEVGSGAIGAVVVVVKVVVVVGRCGTVGQAVAVDVAGGTAWGAGGFEGGTTAERTSPKSTVHHPLGLAITVPTSGANSGQLTLAPILVDL